MRKFILGLALISCLTVSAQQEAKSLRASNGETIGFYEYKPSDYKSKGEKYPLIIFLHGIGERGNGGNQLKKVLKNGLPRNIEKGEKMRFYWNGKWETFIVLSPQLSNKYGSWPNFYVQEMLDYAEEKLNVDPDRMYLTGLSLGGGGVWNYASASTDNARRLAAIAPICGTCQMRNAENIAEADLPIWAFHAKNDDVVGVGCTQNAIRNIRGAKPSVDPIETIWNDGRHGIWDRVYNVKSGYNEPNLFEWFLGQSRKLRANKLPVAKAPAVVTVPAAVGKVKLDGSASYDPDGKIVRHIWKKVSGPSGVLGNVDDALSEITGLNKVGKHEYELKVVDDRGNWDVATVQVDVVEGGGNGNKAPKAEAGEDVSLTLPASSTELDGSASTDEDGRITSYKWAQKSGPSNADIVSSDKASTKIKDLEEGTYRFTLTVTDNRDDESSDEVVINVKRQPESNKAPKANAGSDIRIKVPASTITLNGEKSSDEDGTIISYKWTKISGPDAKIKAPDNSITRVSDLEEGNYVFRLTVMDDENESSTSDVKVIVAGIPNTAPVAVAGEDKTIRLPNSEVVLNGRKSSDKDGEIVQYAWSQVDGPDAQIERPAAPSTKVSELKEGTYVFRLQVKDDKGGTNSDEVKIVVLKKPNSAPTADAGGDKKIQLPADEVALDGRRSNDEDGKITSYKWTKVRGPKADIEDDNSAFTKVSGLEAGTYIFRLTVKDDQDENSSADVKVVVDAMKNKTPTANAGGNKRIRLPESSVTLNGTKSSDEDGEVVSYSWSKEDGGNAEIDNPSGSVTTVSGLKEGKYQFKLTVKDDQDETSYDIVEVIVDKALNAAPVAKARTNGKVELPGNGVLDGSGSSDADGSIKSYEWIKVRGPYVDIEDPKARVTEVKNLEPGKYVFRLIVTDNDNAVSTDQVTLEVEGNQSGENQRPVANAGRDRTINLPASSVVVDAGDSYDADGDIVSYEWTKVSGPDAWIFYPNSRGTSLRRLFTVGTYVFRVTVTDDEGATATDEVVINVLPKRGSDENTSSSAPSFDAAMDVAANNDVADQNSGKQLQVFPNPVVSSMNVQINAAATGAMQVNIYDVSGKLVKRMSMQKMQTVLLQNINVSDLRLGMYHLEVIIDSKTKMVTKFIKK